jgi:hypothetical protein
MKPQAELDNEKIRDMLDNFDSLSPTEENFLGCLILSRFSREENMSKFFKLHVTGEEFDVNNIFDPDDLVLSHVTEEDFGHFLHTLLKRNFEDHYFYFGSSFPNITSISDMIQEKGYCMFTNILMLP